MSMEMQGLVKKSLLMDETLVCHYEKTIHEVKMTVYGMETKWSTGEEKVLGSKKVMLTLLWGMKGAISIDFLEKSETLNSASYCQLLWQN